MTAVVIQSRATANLYTYTPYQPNAASLAAYPGEGDACSSYGNRNFFSTFTDYFGSTGGGGGGAGPNNGCGRGGGEDNSCGSEIGFDRSGLTA
jgi:hypothetical protein